jgi:dipeptidyl aminopeptidase/acylaminoacyl peptidase
VRRGLILLLMLLACRPAAASAEAIVTSDLLRLRQVTSIDVARDGLSVVYAVRSVAERGPGAASETEPQAGGGEAQGPEYEYRSHLFVADLRELAATPRQITFGPRQDGGPALSPDGRRIAFVRADAEPWVGVEREVGTAQVWVIDLRGGEARQVTRLKHGADAPRWSPDGRRLLVHGELPMTELDGQPPWDQERPGRAAPAAGSSSVGPAADPKGGAAGVVPRPDGTREEITAWLRHRAERYDPTVINRLHFQGERTLRRGMTFTQLFLVEVDDETAEPRQLTSEHYDHADARFIGSGGAIVYVTSKPATQHPDRVRQRSLWTMDAGGGGHRPLLALEGFALSSPLPSADGALIAFTAEQLDEPAYRVPQLGLVAASGGAGPTWLMPRFEHGVFGFQWLPARSSILFTTAREGGFPLLEISTGLLDPAPLIETVEGVPAGVHAMGAGGGTIVYTLTTPANPCVLRAVDARGDRLVQDLNPWVAQKRLSAPRVAWIKRPDGTRVQWWIMEPTGREPGKKYPLVLEMHGGPSAMWGPGEFTMWHEFQLLCSWGFGVAFANPRGSGGYGSAFLRGNHQNWGEGPAGDVLAALDQAMLEPWVDGERLLLTGGSYAGYLTAWIVAHEKRFKAAVAQRGVYDLETFFGEGNAWELVPWAMGGFPWDGRYRPIIDRESPFTYVNRIQTPLLIMHASQDLRTGVSQSEMMYRALKALGRPVEYVRYPDADHDLSRTGDPSQRMDRLNRIIEFFERFVDNPRPAP